MIINKRTLSKSDTAILLWQRLGDLRVWPDFLADNGRRRQDVNGIVLLTCGRKKDKGGMRPRYALADIAVFIKAVKLAVPEAGPVKIKSFTLAIDTTNPQRNKFDQRGVRVCKCRIFAKNRPPQRNHFSGFAGAGTGTGTGPH